MSAFARLTRRAVLTLSAVAIIAIAFAAWSASPAATSPPKPSVPLDWNAMPVAAITADERTREMTIELSPVDLPANAGHDIPQPPAAAGVIPVNGYIYGFRTEAVDDAGRSVPPIVIHHFNVMDPADRELFLPISRRLLAAGSETGVIRLPRLLFGARIREGERVLANAMLHNPTNQSYRGVRVRMVVNYVPERRPWPLFAAFPWQLDVAFPVGDKSFDLPPGRSERSYEGRPSVPGDLVVIGGHMHEFGKSIELSDASTGEVIWHGVPTAAPDGSVGPVPIGKLYRLTRIGAHITPEHRYRVKVVYENPTGGVVSAGGMGVVAGLFIPDRGAPWPAAPTSDSLYRQDLRHFLGIKAAGQTVGSHSHHMH
jgi:hypothetical protein